MNNHNNRLTMHHDVADEKPSEQLTVGDCVCIGTTCAFVTGTTFLLSLMSEMGQALNVAVFTIFILTVLVALCLDDPNMWEEEETVTTLMTPLLKMRKAHPTSPGMPISTRWFLGAWFVWIAYAHLFGDGDYSSLDSLWFVVPKTAPLFLSWVLISTTLLEMKFELIHFAMLFVVAALSIVPSTSVMAPQVGVTVNTIRVLCTCCLYAGGNVFLFRRCRDNYHLDRNRVYLGPLLVFWAFFVPFVSLFGIVVNCMLLLFFDKTDTRRIAGPETVHPDPGMYDEEDALGAHDRYERRAATPIEEEEYDDDFIPPRGRVSAADIKAFSQMDEALWITLNLHPSDVELIRRERSRVVATTVAPPPAARPPQPKSQPTQQRQARHQRSSLHYSRRPNR